MGLFEIYQAKAREHSDEDEGRRKTARVAEPIVANLQPGRNYVNPAQFLAVCQYLLEGTNGTRDAAVESGRLRLGRIELVRTEYSDSEWLSAQQIADMCGKHRTYIVRLAQRAKIAHLVKSVGRTRVKLYNFKEILALRAAG